MTLFRTDMQTVAQRNNQFSSLMESNKAMYKERALMDQMVRIRKALKDPSKPKEAKELYLRELRKIETELGLPAVAYNAGEFST